MNYNQYLCIKKPSMKPNITKMDLIHLSKLQKMKRNMYNLNILDYI